MNRNSLVLIVELPSALVAQQLNAALEKLVGVVFQSELGTTIDVFAALVERRETEIESLKMEAYE